MPKQLLRVQRVYKEIDGSNLVNALTTSWTDGSTLRVEHVTDFNEDGGEIVFEPGTSRQEIALYSGFDEATDELTGVTRPNARFTHAAGTFVQAGAEATVEKLIDGYLDDEDVIAPGIPVPSHLYPYFKLGVRNPDDAETIWVEQDADGDLYASGTAVGAVPTFDEDLEVLPDVATEPTPPVDKIPPSGVAPVKPTLSAVARSLVNVEPTWFIDVTLSHTGLKTDGSTAVGVGFRIEWLEGSTVKFREDTTGTFFSKMVEPNKTYTVRAYAYDTTAPGQLSAPESVVVSTALDSTIPATPTGLTLVGGAGGGGIGLLYGRVNQATESDFSHFEVHASTVSGFEATNATVVQTTRNTTFLVDRTIQGPFGYTTTVYVRVKSVDTSGNKSPASTQVSGTAQQIASQDVADLQSDNYVFGSIGWRITKTGNVEFNNGTFRGVLAAGTVIAYSQSQTAGITIDGSIPRISIGTGLRLDGTGTGSVTFGSNCTIYGSGAGSVSIGTGITLNGTGSGQITIGSIVLSGADSKISSATIEASTVRNRSGFPRFEITGVGNGFALYDSAGNKKEFYADSNETIMQSAIQVTGRITAIAGIRVEGAFWVGTDTTEPPTGSVLLYKSGNNLMGKASGRPAVVVAAL